MNLKYLSQEAYKKLKADLNLNKDKYYEDGTDWIQEYFESCEIVDFCRESSVVVDNFTLLQLSLPTDEQKNSCDLANIKTLFTGFKNHITPLQACDPLLWTALCHFEFKDYVLNRWKNESGEVSLEKRFFATEGRSSLLYYNAISRLWWSGYLTYEEENTNNHFSLTDTLMSAQQIQKDLFDQPFSMNRNVVKGMLSALRTMQDKRGDNCTTIFRKCCDSYMNHYGAVSILDFLSAAEIEKIAYEFMAKQVQ